MSFRCCCVIKRRDEFRCRLLHNQQCQRVHETAVGVTEGSWGPAHSAATRQLNSESMLIACLIFLIDIFGQKFSFFS